MSENRRRFGRFGFDGIRFDTIEADYMVQEGVMAKLYRNSAGSAHEDQLVAVVNTGSGYAMLDIGCVSKADDAEAAKN